MSGIFGQLGLNDTDRVFSSTAGQAVVLNLIGEYLNRVNADLAAQMAVFLGNTTENYKLRYKLPGGGRLQRRGGKAESAATKAYGGYDVAFPLEDFGAQFASDDVSLAYMTAGDMERHLSNIAIQNVNTVRFEVLKALLNNTADTFSDPLWGSLTIQPLANGDTVTYPPVLGSESEATEDHYLESGYAATAISDTNNPYTTIRQELEEHFGASTGGDNIAVFINPAETPETEALNDYDQVVDNFIRAGANVNVPVTLPSVPGRILGRTNGVWVVEWRWIPANYMVGIHLEAEAPLYMRVDPADTGLGMGLQLVANSDDFPNVAAHYRHRFGLGVANRLNGVVMELGTGGTYTIPTAYA